MDAEAHELIAGYALDALDEADRARAKELLETSEEAREELRAFTEVAAALATAATGPAPRPELRDRIVDAARAEGQNVVPLDVKRRSRAVPVLAVGAALAACAAIAAGIWGLSVSSDLDDARLALERERAAASILADPVTQTTLTGNAGHLVVGDNGQAVLVLSDAAPVPAGKSYQM
jgi:anti-sigma factor RsiW